MQFPAGQPMKKIWTLLFLATAAVTFALALMFVPESERTENFWLAVSAIAFGELAVWIAFTFPGTARGEQAGAHARGTMVVSTLIYFLAMIALGAVAPQAGMGCAFGARNHPFASTTVFGPGLNHARLVTHGYCCFGATRLVQHTVGLFRKDGMRERRRRRISSHPVACSSSFLSILLRTSALKIRPKRDHFG